MLYPIELRVRALTGRNARAGRWVTQQFRWGKAGVNRKSKATRRLCRFIGRLQRKFEGGKPGGDQKNGFKIALGNFIQKAAPYQGAEHYQGTQQQVQAKGVLV